MTQAAVAVGGGHCPTTSPTEPGIVVRHAASRGAPLSAGAAARSRSSSCCLLVVGLGPLLWLSQVTDHPDPGHPSHPDGAFPHGFNLGAARGRLVADAHRPLLRQHGRVAAGSWASLISSRRPRATCCPCCGRGGRLLSGLVLATLFVPPMVLLVPLYLTDLDVAGRALADDRHVLGGLAAGRGERDQRVLMKRFFDNLPREIFEAARVDGAGPFRLFWSIVLPMSRPILGVVSVFALIATWKDYLWPLLVHPEPELQPLWSACRPCSRRPTSASSSPR